LELIFNLPVDGIADGSLKITFSLPLITRFPVREYCSDKQDSASIAMGYNIGPLAWHRDRVDL
jgi:hypothetical protein